MYMYLIEDITSDLWRLLLRSHQWPVTVDSIANLSSGALKARHSKAQGASPGTGKRNGISPVRAAQNFSLTCVALAGLVNAPFQPRASSASRPRPGLCCAALSAPEITPISLTRMPGRAAQKRSNRLALHCAIFGTVSHAPWHSR